MPDANPPISSPIPLSSRSELRVFGFAGLSLAHVDLRGALARITNASCCGDPMIVVTPNINHLHLAQFSIEMQTCLEHAGLQLADGWPIVFASRVLGTPLPERIAGIDLVEGLVDSGHRFSLAILGGPPGAAMKLAERARATNDVVLVDELVPGWDAEPRRSELMERARELAPDLVLVGIGAPRQEQLALELAAVVHGPIVCCGAAIEVLAGVRPRAPALFQRIGLEWAFRLALEPRRLFNRYVLAGTTFVRLLLSELMRQS